MGVRKNSLQCHTLIFYFFPIFDNSSEPFQFSTFELGYLEHWGRLPGLGLVLVVPVLHTQGEQSKEEANKDDNEDTAKVVD